MNETDASGTVTVTRSTKNGPASVRLTTSDGTGLAGTDYVATAVTVSFKSGQLSKDAQIPIIDDHQAGEDATSTVNLALSNPSKGYVVAAPSTAVLTIIEDTVDAPTGLQASASDSYDVDLSWDSATGADGYAVYRSTTSGSGYTQIGTPTTNSYTDSTAAPNTTYYYVVKATNDDGDSDYSSEASASTPSNLLSNGGFETGSFTNWTAGHSNDCVSPDGCTGSNPMPDPSIDGTTVLGGSYSAFLGEPTTCSSEGVGYDTVFQPLTVPATGTTTLTWYYNGQSDDATDFDGQQVLIEDASGTVLDTLQTTADNSQTWTRQTADLGSYAGTDVRIDFRVYEDGFGDCTGMNVDNVSVTNTP